MKPLLLHLYSNYSDR